MSANNASGGVDPTTNCDLVKQNVIYEEFNQISFIPALLIVIILSFMKRRAKLRKDILDGRPGIQVPVDFLGEEENRFSYAAAYGAMATGIINMFFSSGKDIILTINGPTYLKVFESIVSVIGMGTIYLPFFVCLSTDAKILGAVLGFFYTIGRAYGQILLLSLCPFYEFLSFSSLPIFLDLPAIVLHGILMIRYLVIFVQEVRAKCIKKKFVCQDILGEEADFTVGQHYIDHVKTLLEGVPKNDDKKWYVKGRNFVYAPQPHFKYSVAILSTVIIAGIVIYMFLIASSGAIVSLIVAFKDSWVQNELYLSYVYGEENYRLTVQLMDIGIVSFIVSGVVSALFMYFQMYRMLVSHRRHVKKLIQGDRSFLPNNLTLPHSMVGMSLRFAGYQIAYFLWGAVIMMTILLILSVGISSAVLFLPRILGDQLNKQVASIALALIPTVGMAAFVFLVQQILARFVFRDRSIDSKVVNIDNRRLFLLVSFFFLFLNILVGLVSCLLRILKGMILGILFIGRIDRPLIMKGFTNLDGAYIAYIGFLHLQVATKHPVVRVFSHLLWSGMRRKQLERLRSSVVDVGGVVNSGANNGWLELKEQPPRRPRVSASALNKWFIAVTVIRNPTLIYNRKGFLKHILLGIPNSPTPSQPEEHKISMLTLPNDKDISRGWHQEGTNEDDRKNTTDIIVV